MALQQQIDDGPPIPGEQERAYTVEDQKNFRRIRLAPSENLAINRYEYARAFARELTAKQGAGLVFDIGAGACPMREHVRAAGHEWRGFDLAPRDSEVQRWDLNEPAGFEEKADAAIMLDVIEHLFNPGLALRNVGAALKPGAPLLLTMPNPAWSRARVHLLLRGTLAAFTQHDYDWNHHCFTPWPHVMEGLLQECGFEVERYVTLDGKAGWPKLSLAYPARLVEALGRMAIEKTDKTACGFSFAIVARRKRR